MALSVLQFFASLATERNDMRPIPRNGAKTFAHWIAANVAKLLGIVRIIAQTSIEEITLKADSETP